LVAKVKKRRVSKTDVDRVVQFIVQEREDRIRNKFRKSHEVIWAEVDRQIRMEKPKVKKQEEKAVWQSTVQLGTLADASELTTADVMRLTFPNDRNWHQAHVDITEKDLSEFEVDPDDKEKRVKVQRVTDGLMRSFMAQQHADFGLRERVKLSVKEALHHGGFAAEVRWTTMPKFAGGSSITTLEAPAWVPYSMWNTFPDPSQSVIGTDLFYRGSMILRSYIPMWKARKMPGWVNTNKIPSRLNKVQSGSVQEQTEDVELTIRFGDISIERTDGEPMFLPNRKIILANDILVFTEVNDTAYSPIIYTGWERDDIRDPYYTSPIVKRSPTHKLATFFANEGADAIALKTRPPIVYDNLDPQFNRDGGPVIYPGAKIPGKGTANFKVIETGDPSFAFQAFSIFSRDVERGTALDAPRSGVAAGTEQTATEIVKASQRNEVRTVDFVGILERQALRPFLYMQHDLNKLNLKVYPYQNSEIHTPDFLRMSREDLPKEVHFEIVGSRQLLGEEQRTARFFNAVKATQELPFVSEQADWEEISRQIWVDSGQKNPDRFLKVNDEEDRVQRAVKQLQEQLLPQIQELQKEVMESQLDKQKFAAVVAGKDVEIKDLRGEIRIMEEQQQLQRQRDAFKVEVAKEQAHHAQEGAKEQAHHAKEGSESVHAISNANVEMVNAVKDLTESMRVTVDHLNRDKDIDVIRDNDGNMTGAKVRTLQ